MKTSSEVATLVGIKRQRIQEYEKAGIALKPKIKNNRGYWMYGEAEIERLWQIKFYQELKLEVPEIKAIFSNPNYNKHDEIENLIAGLEQKKKELESMIEIARAYNEMDVLPSDFFYKSGNLENFPYEMVVPLIGKFLKLFNAENVKETFQEQLMVDWPTDNDCKQWFNALKEIIMAYKNKIPYKNEPVQKQVEIMETLDAKVFPYSQIKRTLRLQTIIAAVFKGGLEEDFGKECYKYVKDTINYYYDYKIRHLGKRTDEILQIPVIKIFLNINQLARNRFTTGSTEVQSEIGQLYKMLDELGAFSKTAQLEFLNSLADSIGCKSTRKVFDNDREHGICWFISRAIQIYCKHQQEAMTEEGESDE